MGAGRGAHTNTAEWTLEGICVSVVSITMCACCGLNYTQADADSMEAAAALNGVQSDGQRSLRTSSPGLRQRELTWPLFESMWKHKYERERKTDTDPKLIYQVGLAIAIRLAGWGHCYTRRIG